MSYNQRKVDTKRIEYIEISDVNGKSEVQSPPCGVSDDEERSSESNKELANEDDYQRDHHQSIATFDLNRDVNETETELQHPMSTIDIALMNCGPIFPPHTSSMRLARNSYFS